MPLEEIYEVYQIIAQDEEGKNSKGNKAALMKQVAPLESVEVFQQSLNYHTQLNGKLKHLMSLYERLSTNKSDSYSHANN